MPQMRNPSTMKTDHSKPQTTERVSGPVVYQPGDGFAPRLSDVSLGAYSTLALAHIGDGVYELLMRTALSQAGVTTAAHLHRETVRRVNAPAQAAAVESMLPLLTDAEMAVFKRGRNARVNSVPQHANVSEYHAATGLETLFGWLWLRGETKRLAELFNAVHAVGRA